MENDWLDDAPDFDFENYLKEKQIDAIQQQEINSNFKKKNGENHFYIFWPKYKVKEAARTFFLNDFVKGKNLCLNKHQAFKKDDYYVFSISEKKDYNYLVFEGGVAFNTTFNDVFLMWNKNLKNIKQKNYKSQNIEIKTLGDFIKIQEMIQWVKIQEAIFDSENQKQQLKINSRKIELNDDLK